MNETNIIPVAFSETQNPQKIFNVGDRVRVFDGRLFVDDITTPLSMTLQPATVTRVYHIEDALIPVLDVRFDRDNYDSRCHFVWAVEPLRPELDPAFRIKADKNDRDHAFDERARENFDYERS